MRDAFDDSRFGAITGAYFGCLFMLLGAIGTFFAVWAIGRFLLR